MTKKVKLVAPWAAYCNELEALFDEDPEVNVKVGYSDNEAERIVKLFVSDTDKAMALEKLLPSEKTFGNVTLHISIIPPNIEEMDDETLFKKAFDKNPALNYVETTKVFETDTTFVVFNKVVVQYYNDDLGDRNGLRSTLYQEIAKEVFNERPDVRFCTDKYRTAKRTLSYENGEF